MSGISRRSFLRRLGQGAGILCAASILPTCNIINSSKAKRPNIVLVLTDDQGYGDLGIHGNEIIRTPNVNRFAKESVEFTNFYASPVCAPTRASLMTGRYNFRTGVVDTYKGRAMMDTGEYTLAEAFRDNGYRTAIFGKWHLGDNYPMRPVDQGFEESIIHPGGGLTQPSDLPGNSYYDPTLLHNGQYEKFSGYCMDVYTEQSLQFIEQNADKPFFVYLSTNTPHDPLQIEESQYKHHLENGLAENVAKVYGMIENIDTNFGRLISKLDELQLSENTIVIFMTDNGPALWRSQRYNAELRESKGHVYDGGIRVPFFIRWPAQLKMSKKLNQIGAHIDVMPTLLEACNIKIDNPVKMDGVSLLPLLKENNEQWPDRTLFIQWHRGDAPQRFRCFAARNQKYKLVQAQGGPGHENIFPEEEMKFELFDMENDPGEKTDISAQFPEVVEQMKKDYEEWFTNVSSRGYDPPRIHIGSDQENPVRLTQQDWRGSKAWGDEDLGFWEVTVVSAGVYDMHLILSKDTEVDTKATFQEGNLKREGIIKKGSNSVVFENVPFRVGDSKFEAWITKNNKKMGVRFLDVYKRS